MGTTTVSPIEIRIGASFNVLCTFISTGRVRGSPHSGHYGLTIKNLNPKSQIGGQPAGLPFTSGVSDAFGAGQ
jgi:hypothetical protein